MKTATELGTAIGKVGTLTKLYGLQVEVTILDARQRFGETDYLVTPVTGSGELWVTTHYVKNIH